MIRRDKEKTAKAGFSDKRSYIGFRGHPGTTYDHSCEYLFGKDASKRRDGIRNWYNRCCAECAKYCGDDGHLHHIVGGRGLQRCWCVENLIWLCPKCHQDKHVQVSWSSWAKKERQHAK